MRKFAKEGHEVYVVCPLERRFNLNTTLLKLGDVTILQIRTLNLQKANRLEKGFGMLLLEWQFLRGVKKYFKDVKFDLVLYSTPPITFTKIVNFIKGRDNAVSYLLLKDIFPQNAVDLDMLNPKGLLYDYFKKKEKQLYLASDFIGCMSPANVSYLLAHNPYIDKSVVEVNPNSIEPIVQKLPYDNQIEIREKYNIPADAIVFLYGGNLGRPQGLAFLKEVMTSFCNDKLIFFLIIGSGTEYKYVETWFKRYSPSNALLIEGLPKNDYDNLLFCSDVGLIFLDKHFTIPNFPSRLLSYMECSMPVLAATDVHTDLGSIMQENGFGFWCENGDLDAFCTYVSRLAADETLRFEMGNKGHAFMLANYLVQESYMKIMNRMTLIKN
ncbi:glycosyltransferase family 4 protein [Pedobacter frigoris]|uniref:glycosyltransferase family 4 protein n=1 Tax=Pedobacter frigoris TaxID=2571272 RepID=UPI00292FC29F|nr:glycosyltransferase family 4 protein [Pedobacter frigoris]